MVLPKTRSPAGEPPHDRRNAPRHSPTAHRRSGRRPPRIPRPGRRRGRPRGAEARLDRGRGARAHRPARRADARHPGRGRPLGRRLPPRPRASTPPARSPARRRWSGPTSSCATCACCKKALRDIEPHGRPRIPGPVATLPAGQVAARIFPQRPLRPRLLRRRHRRGLDGARASRALDLPATQAVAYRARDRQGSVALVLGGGNVSSIGPMDALYKLFVEDQRGAVQDPSGQRLPRRRCSRRRSGRSIERGFFRQVYGGAEEGAYLCRHPGVDEIHITGSDRTYEAIVFGPGDGGRGEEARAGRPLLDKPVTAELGNVSPVIVVPGPWSAKPTSPTRPRTWSTMLANNAGFNCNATRVIVHPRRLAGARAAARRGPQAPRQGAEPQRLLPRRRRALRRASRRPPRGRDLRPAGVRRERRPPPLGADPGARPRAPRRHLLHHRGLLRRLRRGAARRAGRARFLDRAVAFCNGTLWGTLNATLIVHPGSLADPAAARAVDLAVERPALRHGVGQPLGGGRATAWW